MEEFITNFDTTAELEAFSATTEFKEPHVALTKDTGKVHFFEVPPHDYSQDYFTMAVTSGGDIKWSGSTTDNTLSYSKDGGDNWITANSMDTISVTAGDKILWKGTEMTSLIFGGIGKFSGDTTVRYSIEGNVMSLLFGDNFKGQTSLSGKNFALYGLFSGSTNVTSAENISLPAKILATGCYYSMFFDCTSLTIAPELPATTLATQCYAGMFSNCTSLTVAPKLPAMVLKDSCYQYMFRGCTSLTKAPKLPATALASQCYGSMFEGCGSLTTVPELPASMLMQFCYNSMFNGCTSLNSIKCLATNIGASSCTSNWVRNVASNGTFTKAASMESWTTGPNGIPSGWTVVNV